MIGTTITPEIALLAELLQLHSGGASADVHGFTSAELVERMATGQLDELKRRSIDDGRTHFLVGKVTVGQLAITLFGEHTESGVGGNV